METDPTVNAAKETFKLLGNLNYFFLWLGQTISQLGDSIYEMAIVWFALKLTGSPLSTGMVALAAALPYPILGLVAGAYVDRWNRKTTMIRADLLRAAVLVTIPVLSAFGALRVWHLAAAAFALTSIRAFFYPALMASLPAIVPKEQLVRANSFMVLSFQAARVLGPAAAGCLLSVLSIESLFTIDTATFIASVAMLMPVSMPREVPPREIAGETARRGVIGDIAEAARYLRSTPALFWCVGLFGLGLVPISGLTRIGLPIFAAQVLLAGERGFGYMLAARSLGMILGAMLLSHVRFRRYERTICAGWVAWGLCFVAFAFARDLYLSVGLLVAAGLAECAIDVPTEAFIQSTVPQDKMGKVFSVWSTTGFTGDALSAALAGPMVAWLGVSPAFAAGGVLVSLFGVVGFRTVGSPARGEKAGVASA